MISEKIKLSSDLPIDIVMDKIAIGIDNRFEFFSDKILLGYIHEGRLDAVINGAMAADPFKARVSGIIFNENGVTKIEFDAKIGIVSLIILSVWFLPLLFILQHEKNQNLVSIMYLVSISTTMSLFWFLLIRIKLNWDGRRLEKWLTYQLNTR